MSIDITKFERMGYTLTSTEEEAGEGYFVLFKGDRITNKTVIVDTNKELITTKVFSDPYGDSSCYRRTEEMTFEMLNALVELIF